MWMIGLWAILLVALLVGGVVAVHALWNRFGSDQESSRGGGRPLDVLEGGYARGDVDRDESEPTPQRPFFGGETRTGMTGVTMATAVLMVGSVACSSPPNDNVEMIEIRGGRVPVTQLRGVVEALCEAKDVAARDAEAARTIFFDHAHDRLHDIAAAEEVDRASAARLLEAKQVVEADFDGTAGPELASDLGQLVATVGDALGDLSVSASGCDG
jgi:hypothetical protein